MKRLALSAFAWGIAFTVALIAFTGGFDTTARAGEFRCASRALEFTLSFDRHSYKVTKVRVCAGGRITLYGRRVNGT